MEGFTPSHSFVLITAINTSVPTVSKRAGVHSCPLLTVCLGASLVAQMVKNLPAMQETQVQSLGREDPLENEVATHSSILAWRIPWTEEPGGIQSIGSKRVGHD